MNLTDQDSSTQTQYSAAKYTSTKYWCEGGEYLQFYTAFLKFILYYSMETQFSF